MKEKVYLLIGVGIGFAAGFFLAKNRYDKIMNEELNELREHYAKKEEKVDEESDKETFKKDVNETYENLRSAYTSSAEEDAAEKEHPEEEHIFMITPKEYHETYPEFDKVDITYYTKDRVFADAQEELVDDPRTIFGEAYEAIMESEEITDEEVYVRNIDIDCDFCISIEDVAYQEAVMHTEVIYS